MSRAKFEAAISGFPYEADIRRFGNDSAWPGSYRDIGVDLAWHMWLAGRESMRDEAEKALDGAPMTWMSHHEAALLVSQLKP